MKRSASFYSIPYPVKHPVTRHRYTVVGVVGLVLMVMGVFAVKSGSAKGPASDPVAGDVAGPEFVAGFEDIPLPSGMANLPGSQTVFDSREGRIIDALVTGLATDRLTSMMVRNFYRETLPQLGWQSLAPEESLNRAESVSEDHFSEDRFMREGEVLVLQLTRIDEVIQARFTLTPGP